MLMPTNATFPSLVGMESCEFATTARMPSGYRRRHQPEPGTILNTNKVYFSAEPLYVSQLLGV